MTDALVIPTYAMVVVTKAVAANKMRWPACSLSNVPPTAVLLKSNGPSAAPVWMADVGAVGSLGSALEFICSAYSNVDMPLDSMPKIMVQKRLEFCGRIPDSHIS